MRKTYIFAAIAALLLTVGLSASTAGAASSPLRGHLDTVVGQGGTIYVAGWAADLDTPHTTINAAVTINGGGLIATPAHDVRTDVGNAYPALGDAHGFHESILGIRAGTYTVCGYALDPHGGANLQIGCQRVAVPIDVPAGGHFDSLKALGGGRLQVTGWAADINTPATPTRVQVYLGGTPNAAYKAVPTTANVSRPDVWAAYPALGPNHGFSVTTLARLGANLVCVYASDTYPLGPPTFLGCHNVTVT